MVHLVPMTRSEYPTYIEPAIDDYAQDKAKAGNLHPDRALEMARQDFAALLPQGVASPEQYLYTIQEADAGAKVGFIWLGIREEGAKRFPMLMQIWIAEQYRRQGYATQALLVLEGQVGELGFDEIWLHVFGHNHAARALYEKLGYVTTNLNMYKAFVPPVASA